MYDFKTRIELTICSYFLTNHTDFSIDVKLYTFTVFSHIRHENIIDNINVFYTISDITKYFQTFICIKHIFQMPFHF